MIGKKWSEVSIWSTVFVVCGVAPFILSILADGGKLGFVAGIFNALK